MHLCKSDKKYNFLPIHKNHHSPIRPLNGVHLQPVCPRSGRGARLGARPALRPPPGDADSAVLTAPGERRVLYLVDDGHGSTQSPLLPPCPAHALSATLPLSGWRQLAACPGHVCTCVNTTSRSTELGPPSPPGACTCCRWRQSLSIPGTIRGGDTSLVLVSAQNSRQHRLLSPERGQHAGQPRPSGSQSLLRCPG